MLTEPVSSTLGLYEGISICKSLQFLNNYVCASLHAYLEVKRICKNSV